VKNNFVDILLVIFILTVSFIFTESIGIHNYGDSPSYRLMIKSLIYDKDLILDKKDIQRCKKDKDRLNGTYVFIDKEGKIKYGKPLLYPLIALPFFFIFKTFGLSLLNSLFLGGSIICGFCYLKKYFNRFYSLILNLLFFFCSYIPFYTGWMTPDEMIFFACCLVMYLILSKNKPELAAFVIGAVTSAKVIFSLLLIPLFTVLIEEKAYRRLKNTLCLYLIGLLSMLILTFIFLGKVSPYVETSGYIPAQTKPYSTEEDIKNSLIIVPSLFIGIYFTSWNLFFRNLLNFFIGRFTGVIWYAFPAFVCIIFYLLSVQKMRKKEKNIGISIILAAFFLVLILVILRPLNYFGGKDFIGNRYYFILPAMLFLPLKKIHPYKLILLFSLGFIVTFPILKTELLSKNRDFFYSPYIFKHSAYTCSFPLKYAPLEISQIESFMVYKLKLSKNTFVYLPCGMKKRKKEEILITPNQEVVIVCQKKCGFLKLSSERQSIILHPQIILRDRIHHQYKTFYYFKPNKQMWLKLFF